MPGQADRHARDSRIWRTFRRGGRIGWTTTVPAATITVDTRPNLALMTSAKNQPSHSPPVGSPHSFGLGGELLGGRPEGLA
jgi:hypothetical protein